MEKKLENTFLNALEDNKDRLYRICRSYSSDTEDTKDLFQEVLLNIWKSLPSFTNQSNIDTWIYRITINICLRTKLYSEKKKKFFVQRESVKLGNIGETVSSNENEKQFLKLSECIKKLEGVEKSIILLYLEDLPYKKIASILDLTENHIAVKIKRIKNKLLTCLKS